MIKFLKYLYSFCADKKAVVAVEFSIVLPVLLILFLGSVEVSNALYARQQLMSATNIAQELLVSETNLTNLNNSLPALGDLLRDTVEGFANNNQIGFVYSLIDKGARIPDPTMNAFDRRHLYIAYQVEFGDVDTIAPRIPYKNRAGIIQKPYFEGNRIPLTDPIHISITPTGTLNTTTTEQYVVLEGRMQYDPMFRATAYTVNMETLTFRFEATAVNSYQRHANLPFPDNRSLY